MGGLYMAWAKIARKPRTPVLYARQACWSVGATFTPRMCPSRFTVPSPQSCLRTGATRTEDARARAEHQSWESARRRGRIWPGSPKDLSAASRRPVRPGSLAKGHRGLPKKRHEEKKYRHERQKVYHGTEQAEVESLGQTRQSS
jgi:hypothetical protein